MPSTQASSGPLEEGREAYGSYGAQAKAWREFYTVLATY